jgi:lysophospholipase L1-like esterase
MKKILLIFSIVASTLIMAQQKPTLFLIGDSTMANKENPDKNPEHGWGQVFPQFLTPGIEIQNHAVNGRSSKVSERKGDGIRWKNN